MIYNISRLLIFIILAFLLLFILLRLKILVVVNRDTLKSKVIVKNKVAAAILSIVMICIFIISIYPFEGFFLTFESVEQSLNYRVFQFNRSDNYITKSDNCYFIFSKNSSAGNINYHSAHINSDKSVGLIDFQSTHHDYSNSSIIDKEDNVHLISCKAIYNKNASETCYFIKYSLPKNQTNNHIINWNNENLNCIFYQKGVYGLYQVIKEGDFADTIDLTVDDVSVKLEF